MNNQVIISINGEEHSIKKMPLGKIAEVFQALEQLPKQFEDFDKLSTDTLVEKLPEMISTALPELTKILSIASGIEQEELQERAGLDEITDLVIAVLDVNS
jgi:hypothetical protein